VVYTEVLKQRPHVDEVEERLEIGDIYGTENKTIKYEDQ
jgi:hypothetical protein